MSRVVALAALPLAVLPPPGAAEDAPRPGAAAGLTLECDAVAARHAATGRTRQGGTAGRSHGTAAGEADAGSARDAGVPVRFVFEFDGDRGRVRYPAAITPVVHGGGDAAGWWPIRDLAAGDDAFTGRIALNLFNTARFAIDRRSGGLVLTGLDTSVTGRCARATPGPRLF